MYHIPFQLGALPARSGVRPRPRWRSLQRSPYIAGGEGAAPKNLTPVDPIVLTLFSFQTLACLWQCDRTCNVHSIQVFVLHYVIHYLLRVLPACGYCFAWHHHCESVCVSWLRPHHVFSACRSAANRFKLLYNSAMLCHILQIFLLYVFLCNISLVFCEF